MASPCKRRVRPRLSQAKRSNQGKVSGCLNSLSHLSQFTLHLSLPLFSCLCIKCGQSRFFPRRSSPYKKLIPTVYTTVPAPHVVLLTWWQLLHAVRASAFFLSFFFLNAYIILLYLLHGHSSIRRSRDHLLPSQSSLLKSLEEKNINCLGKLM